MVGSFFPLLPKAELNSGPYSEDLLQDGQDIMVMKHETNREGQDVFGTLLKQFPVLYKIIFSYEKTAASFVIYIDDRWF